MNDYHIPVLLKESVDGLNVKKGGVYVDATFGGGGHSREILARLDGTGCLYGFDQDWDAYIHLMDQHQDMAKGNGNFRFVRSNFRYVRNFLLYYDTPQIDGLLADLGVSSHHFDEADRGFSFRFDAPLDMRMNQKGGMTAAELINDYDEDRLANVLYLYGELKNSRRLASEIVRRRKDQGIVTAGDLQAILEPLLPVQRLKKEMAKVFQALRIEVNHEMDALRALLEQTPRILKPGGRLVVITYHSLEDRLVKNMMRTGNCDGKEEKDFYGNSTSPFTLVNKKVVEPSAAEQTANPRSRSAKLRIAERTDEK